MAKQLPSPSVGCVLEQFGAGQMQHGITEELQLFMVEFGETLVWVGAVGNSSACWLELTKRHQLFNVSFKLACSILSY